MVDDPLSLVVASHPDITLAQKKEFYSSNLYTGKILEEYIDNLFYPQSLEYRAFEDCEKFGSILEEN